MFPGSYFGKRYWTRSYWPGGDVVAGGALLLALHGTYGASPYVVVPPAVTANAPAGMTFTPIRVGQVQVTPKILKVSYGKIVAGGETGSEAGVAYVLPAGKIPVRCGPSRTEAGASARACGRVVQVATGKVVGSAGGKVVASSSRIEVKTGEAISTAGGWVRMQGAFLHTTCGPGQATGIRNLTDMEVLMLYRQMRRARVVAFNKKV